jgi:hypothetical protein
MKKTISIISLFSIFLTAIPFALHAQEMARVTVTVKNLTYLSTATDPTDPTVGTMDFYAKIFIGDKMKKIPVRTGNQLRDLNWQFTTTTSSSTANILIEVWDYDAFFTGSDDRVCVDGKSRGIAKTISTMEVYNLDFHSRNRCTESGKESAAISYNITIEPTRTAYLIQGIWKQVKSEIKTGNGEWEQLLNTSGSPNCRADDFFIFNKNSTYKLYAGADKCVPPEPASKTGAWSFQNNDTKLQLNIPGNSLAIIYTVHWIDKTKMILSTSSTTGGVTNYNRVTYGH